MKKLNPVVVVPVKLSEVSRSRDRMTAPTTPDRMPISAMKLDSSTSIPTCKVAIASQTSSSP